MADVFPDNPDFPDLHLEIKDPELAIWSHETGKWIKGRIQDIETDQGTMFSKLSSQVNFKVICFIIYCELTPGCRRISSETI